MKKEEILVGASFGVLGNEHSVFKYQKGVIALWTSLQSNETHFYANIGAIEDTYMLVYVAFFDKIVKKRLYYKDLIKK